MCKTSDERRSIPSLHIPGNRKNQARCSFPLPLIFVLFTLYCFATPMTTHLPNRFLCGCCKEPEACAYFEAVDPSVSANPCSIIPPIIDPQCPGQSGRVALPLWTPICCPWSQRYRGQILVHTSSTKGRVHNIWLYSFSTGSM